MLCLSARKGSYQMLIDVSLLEKDTCCVTAFEHREEIDHIMSLYRTIAFATTRADKIVKTAVETSSAACCYYKK